MKGFVEATQGEDPYLTEPLHRDIDGLTCKRKHWNM